MDQSPAIARRPRTRAAPDAPAPRSGPGALAVWLRAFRRWWHGRVIGRIERTEVLARIEGEGGWTARYTFMTLMSAGIAVLGLLQSSPAVVIGAMLISPLMGPIIALGFALATFDWREIRQSLVALLGGSLLAVLFTALVVTLSPLDAVTPEILARTRPNLFDLLVAVFSALAGAYAMMRGRGETVVGVAIATALMPPLATVGFGLATSNSAVFTGALALFITNAVAIALSAAVMARLHGFGSELSPRQTRLQGAFILAVMALLAVPLALALKQIAWEAVAAGRARTAIERHFGPDSRVSELDFRFGDNPVSARAVVLTPRYDVRAGPELMERLSDLLGRPIRLQLRQVVTDQDMGPLVRERSELLRARQLADAASGQSAAIARELLLVTGAGAGAAAADAERRQAIVRADGPAGIARLTRWRLEEARIAAAHPGWSIAILPPADAELRVPFPADTAEPDAETLAAIETASWALGRWNADAAQLVGRAASDEPDPDDLARARADAVAALLAGAGIATDVATDPPGPAQREREREAGTAAFRHVEIAPASNTP